MTSNEEHQTIGWTYSSIYSCLGGLDYNDNLYETMVTGMNYLLFAAFLTSILNFCFVLVNGFAVRRLSSLLFSASLMTQDITINVRP